MDTEFLDWALADFSGYAAADELYDGPFCILSAVDNRCYKRILYEVLDHDPDHDDIRAFLGRLKTALDTRDLKLLGITTDGSSLYPEPLAEVLSGVPHQLCQFHVIKEITKGVLKAVAKARESLAQFKPKLKRGRPSSKDKEARRRARSGTAERLNVPADSRTDHHMAHYRVPGSEVRYAGQIQTPAGRCFLIGAIIADIAQLPEDAAYLDMTPGLGERNPGRQIRDVTATTA
jgi:hypothetical protein